LLILNERSLRADASDPGRARAPLSFLHVHPASPNRRPPVHPLSTLVEKLRCDTCWSLSPVSPLLLKLVILAIQPCNVLWIASKKLNIFHFLAICLLAA